MTIERALELLPQMRDSEWITVVGQVTAIYTDEAKEAFNMAISALKWQEENRWVPVTEKLPEPFEEVIVTDIETINTHTGMYHGGGYWNTDTGCAKNRIIAWKPLPEPYTEGES